MPTIIDLSHPIGDGTITYPGLPGPVISDHLSREASRARYAEGYEFQIGRIDMVANTGTYLDTPFHRFADGHDLAGLDLARVAAVPGVLDRGDGSAGSRRTTPRRASTSPDGPCSCTPGGRSTGEPSTTATRATRSSDRPPPSCSSTVARRWSASTPSTSTTPGRASGRSTRCCSAAEIPIVEHLRGLDELAGRPFTFFAVPPAIVGMGTFPVRAIAVV